MHSFHPTRKPIHQKPAIISHNTSECVCAPLSCSHLLLKKKKKEKIWTGGFSMKVVHLLRLEFATLEELCVGGGLKKAIRVTWTLQEHFFKKKKTTQIKFIATVIWNWWDCASVGFIFFFFFFWKKWVWSVCVLTFEVLICHSQMGENVRSCGSTRKEYGLSLCSTCRILFDGGLITLLLLHSGWFCAMLKSGPSRQCDVYILLEAMH